MPARQATSIHFAVWPPVATTLAQTGVLRRRAFFYEDRRSSLSAAHDIVDDGTRGEAVDDGR